MKKVLGMIAAAGAGYIAGVLLAPKSGQETREDLKKKADEARVVAAKKSEQAKAVYHESAAKVKKGAAEIGTDVDALSKKARTSASHISKEAKELGVEAKRHLGRAADTASKTTRGVGQSVNKMR
jgi:gas vesicle protein